MSGPIVFISRSRVKEGRMDEFREMQRERTPRLEAEKPRTAAFLPYLDESTRSVTIIHVFANADAFDEHMVGAAERSAGAYEVIDPISFEIYGRPSEEALEVFRAAAARGIRLEHYPELGPAFLRTS
jgi:quinol monooxygenase YgiN